MKSALQKVRQCYTCRNKRAREEGGKRAHFLVFRCDEMDIQFGIETDWKAGNNMPDRCEKYDKQMLE